MPRSSSSRTSIVVRRKENQAKILKFLMKRAGPPPETSLCPYHKVKLKGLCTSQTDPLLKHAGQWYAFCGRCREARFSAPLFFAPVLLRENEEFRALIEERESLQPKARGGSSVQVSSESQGEPSGSMN